MKQLLLVDGNALIHRAYHALPELTDKQGNLVNAVYGFSSALLSAFSKIQPEFAIVTFDVGRHTFRNDIFNQYKANRPETDEGLVGQFPLVRAVTKSLNIPIFGVEGYEADDLIGTLANKAQKEKDLEVIILTGDNDALQLVNNKVKVFTFGRGMSDSKVYGPDEVRSKYGLSPEQIIDYKALAGDSSDNIPGVKGIGDKSAKSLLQKYKDLDNIFKHLSEISDSLAKKLSKDRENAFVSRKLATIAQDVPIELDLTKCTVNQFDGYQAKKLFAELGFVSLIPRLPKEAVKPNQAGLFSPEEEKQFSHEQGRGKKGSQSERIDQDLEPILAKITKRGVLIDTEKLNSLSKLAGSKIKQLEKQIFALSGHSFNLNSPSQLAPVLYDELNLSPDQGKRIRRGKTHRSTAASELEKLKGQHKIIPLILQYREYTKLKNTYLDPLPTMVDKDNRLHTTFEQDTSTGRLSSKNPNLQNIPVQEGMGLEIRKAFVAPKGKLLLSADYSQIELRVAATISQDENMLKAFAQNRDFHSEVSTALKIDRRMAKAINFGILYGMNAYGLASRLEISSDQAKQYIENYFNAFPGLKKYMDQTIKFARENGYVESIFGRRRYIPEINSANGMVRMGAERAAINMPLQGAAADIIKLAMINIDSKYPNLKMVLQIHDELLFEIEKNQDPDLEENIARIMSSVYDLGVPLKVDLAKGKSWGEMKSIA